MANYAIICHILFYEMRNKQMNAHKDDITEKFLNAQGDNNDT